MRKVKRSEIKHLSKKISQSNQKFIKKKECNKDLSVKNNFINIFR